MTLWLEELLFLSNTKLSVLIKWSSLTAKAVNLSSYSVEINSCATLVLLAASAVQYFMPAVSQLVNVGFFTFGICASSHYLNDFPLFFFLCLKNVLFSFPVEQALETHCLRYFETLLNLTLFVRILAKCFSTQKNQKHIIWEQILCSSQK